MSMTKNHPAFDRMMEENRERERMEFLEREERFLLDRLGVPPRKASGSVSGSNLPKKAGFPPTPSRK